MSYTPPSKPTFICTFCWKPQFPPSKPKVIGSSRIACGPCHAAVLDLSICWVCGEIIVRGEDVISLGWCFWHRVCFGCLICATRVSVPRDHDDGRKVELDRIPLCAVCEIETAGDDIEDVKEKGVEHISLWDDGISKARLQRIEEARGHELGAERNAASVDDLRKRRRRRRAEIRSSSPLPGRPSRREGDPDPIVLGDDGSHDAFEGDQEIYLSVLDPLGDLAFKPSRTKPLPHWMTLLPNNRAPQHHERRISYPWASVDLAPRSRRATHTVDSSRVRAQSLRFEPAHEILHTPRPAIKHTRTFPKCVNTAPARKSFTHTIGLSTDASSAVTREVSSFPFFQNPRQPILPSSESSWGTGRARSPFVGSREFVERIERKGSLVSDGGSSRKSSYVGNEGERGGKGKGKEINLDAIRESDRGTDTEMITPSKEKMANLGAKGF